eukprot:5856795-Lingulodinium_polyedra.AAC.1
MDLWKKVEQPQARLVHRQGHLELAREVRISEHVNQEGLDVPLEGSKRLRLCHGQRGVRSAVAEVTIAPRLSQ